jgi:hypothetical protein
MKKGTKAYKKPKLTKHDVDLGVFGDYRNTVNNNSNQSHGGKITPESL